MYVQQVSLCVCACEQPYLTRHLIPQSSSSWPNRSRSRAGGPALCTFLLFLLWFSICPPITTDGCRRNISSADGASKALGLPGQIGTETGEYRHRIFDWAPMGKHWEGCHSYIYFFPPTLPHCSHFKCSSYCRLWLNNICLEMRGQHFLLAVRKRRTICQIFGQLYKDLQMTKCRCLRQNEWLHLCWKEDWLDLVQKKWDNSQC